MSPLAREDSKITARGHMKDRVYLLTLYFPCKYFSFIPIFIRALMKAQAIGIMIAWAIKNRKVNQKPNSLHKKTSETQFIVFLIINNSVNQDQF